MDTGDDGDGGTYPGDGGTTTASAGGGGGGGCFIAAASYEDAKENATIIDKIIEKAIKLFY
jgi:hypothetical protein